MNLLARRIVISAVAAIASAACTATVPVATAQASTTPPAISKYSFGMHFPGYGSHAYPAMGFSSTRIWDMGVTWADLQPSAPPLLSTTAPWNSTALTKLDKIVDGFHSRGVDPVIVLGWTPSWAADSCTHVVNGHDYGARTCAPSDTSLTGPWGTYVKFLANRYNGKNGHARVNYFETWNEWNLPFGYNDSLSKLAQLQYTAYQAVHAQGQRLLAPSFAITYGYSSVDVNRLGSLLAQSHGTTFDVVNVHLYPTFQYAKSNFGPEWSIRRLGTVRSVLAKYHVSKPVWDTEVNVGYAPGKIVFTGNNGAAQVDRTLILATENHVDRTFWYAADDRGWGGTWLENSDYKTLATPGIAYKFMRGTLTGARPYGCSVKTVGTNKWNYTCRYHLASGKNMLALWTTGSAFYYHGPSGTQYWYTTVGARHAASHSTRLTITHNPVFISGTFSV